MGNTIIIEALEDKREKVQEELHGAERAVQHHPEYVKEVHQRLITLKEIFSQINVALQSCDNLPKTWWIGGTQIGEGNIKRPLNDAWHAANKNVSSTKKELEGMSTRLNSSMNNVAELKETIEEINREIENQKKS